MTQSVHVVRDAGVGVIVDARAPGVPCIVHWGRDLGALCEAELEALVEAAEPGVGPSSVDQPQRLSLLAMATEGWTGRPGLAGHRPAAGPRAAASWPSFILQSAEVQPAQLRYLLADPEAGLEVECLLQLTPEGLLSTSARVTNTGSEDYVLAGLHSTLPLPRRATQVLDFTGRWPLERVAQRHDLARGTWSRESRHGRPGHDSAYLLTLGVPGFGFRTGEVWSTALAWSGDSVVWADRAATGHTTIGAGELLGPGEMVLAPGQSYQAPAALSAWSDRGLDGISERFHGWVRAQGVARRSGRPLAPRPVVLNTWEAVYFDHSLERLGELADVAADLGVERFVLDDGWFTGRRSDRTSLGDWTVDSAVWPQGLGPLIDRVRGLGMEFGLWVEPEMVNLDSDLARAHPDWILSSGADRLPLPWRHQHVLDLTQPDAYRHVRDALTALLSTYEIAFLKWDHNRDLVEGPAHAQTLATYRLLDELHEAFPAVEIESCASGGARIDLGIVGKVDRFWPSDTNDALERQRVQRWTGLLMPPEYLGAHVGAGTAHTTGRHHKIGFRLATALLGHAGIEWDLTAATAQELEHLRSWIDFYRQVRPTVHTGTSVHLDTADDTTWIQGVVATDQTEAVFVLAAMAAQPETFREPVRFVGLDPERTYRVEIVDFGAPALAVEDAPPRWWATGSATLAGSALMGVGLALPALVPETGVVFHLTQIDQEHRP